MKIRELLLSICTVAADGAALAMTLMQEQKFQAIRAMADKGIILLDDETKEQSHIQTKVELQVWDIQEDEWLEIATITCDKRETLDQCCHRIKGYATRFKSPGTFRLIVHHASLHGAEFTIKGGIIQ